MIENKQDTKQTLQEIRKKLRLSMDGIVSTLMREQGIRYKLNFGINLPRIQEIAALYNPSAELADRLWQEDVRELKILALLLHPHQQFTPTKAAQWTAAIQHIEIAELYCLKLMQHLDFAPTCANTWIKSEEEYTQTIGYTLYARLFTKGIKIDDEAAKRFIDAAKESIEKGGRRTKSAALLALKRYGRSSAKDAETILLMFKSFESSAILEQNEIFNDLQFEFDYYG